MPERYKPNKLKSAVIAGGTIASISGLSLLGYGINKVRIEEDAQNSQKAAITRQFVDEHQNPSKRDYLELELDLQRTEKGFKNDTVIITIAGGVTSSLGIAALQTAFMFMDTHTHDRRRKDEQTESLV